MTIEETIRIMNGLRRSQSTADSAIEVERRFLFTIGECEIFDVPGRKVRQAFLGLPKDLIGEKNPDDPMGFVLAGHHYRYSWIPEPEIWLVRETDPLEKWAVLMFHEYPERYAMKKYKIPYDEAHAFVANVAEHAGRLTFPEELVAAFSRMVA